MKSFCLFIYTDRHLEFGFEQEEIKYYNNEGNVKYLPDHSNTKTKVKKIDWLTG